MSDKQPAAGGAPPPKPRGFPVIAGIIALVLSFVLVIQVVRTGEVDKYLVGALVVLALTFSGYGGDRLIERWLERKGGGSDGGPSD